MVECWSVGGGLSSESPGRHFVYRYRTHEVGIRTHIVFEGLKGGLEDVVVGISLQLSDGGSNTWSGKSEEDADQSRDIYTRSTYQEWPTAEACPSGQV